MESLKLHQVGGKRHVAISHNETFKNKHEKTDHQLTAVNDEQKSNQFQLIYWNVFLI